jgi:hypothetical protein
MRPSCARGGAIPLGRAPENQGLFGEPGSRSGESLPGSGPCSAPICSGSGAAHTPDRASHHLCSLKLKLCHMAAGTRAGTHEADAGCKLRWLLLAFAGCKTGDTRNIGVSLDCKMHAC